MKRIYCLLLVAVFVLAVTCVAMAEDLKQGPEIYVDYGLGGTSNLSYNNTDSDYSSQFKKTDFGQSVIGAEYPVSKWKFGIEYSWTNDYEEEPSFSASYTYKADSSLTLLKAGYQVMDSKQFQLYLNAVCAWDSNVRSLYSSSSRYLTEDIDTNGLLIGPEVCYALNDALKLQGFFGYAVYVSTKEADKYDGYAYSYLHEADDESMTLLNVKLIYSFADHWAAAIGYRAKEIKYEFSAYSDKLTDKQDMLTVGVAYKF